MYYKYIYIRNRMLHTGIKSPYIYIYAIYAIATLCQNEHSVAIAGIDLCHIYIFVCYGDFLREQTKASMTC
jgi:hypothetical protein